MDSLLRRIVCGFASFEPVSRYRCPFHLASFGSAVGGRNPSDSRAGRCAPLRSGRFTMAMMLGISRSIAKAARLGQYAAIPEHFGPARAVLVSGDGNHAYFFAVHLVYPLLPLALAGD